MPDVAVSGLKVGDVVDGWTVLDNARKVGSDGALLRHVLTLRGEDGEMRTSYLSATRRVTRSSRRSV